jgi:alpha-galactosidase
LISPLNGSEDSVTESVARDGNEAVVFAFLHSSQMGYPFPQIFLRGLDPKAMYTMQALDGGALPGMPASASGAYWMGKGLSADLRGDFQAAAFLLKRTPLTDGKAN